MWADLARGNLVPLALACALFIAALDVAAEAVDESCAHNTTEDDERDLADYSVGKPGKKCDDGNECQCSPSGIPVCLGERLINPHGNFSCTS